METLKFKTNIKCGGCIAAVTPALNGIKEIAQWEVDVAQPEKILTVQGNNVAADVVVQALKEKGYNAEVV